MQSGGNVSSLTFKVSSTKFADCPPESVISQCRDRLVNDVFGGLFEEYPGPKVLIVDSVTARNLNDLISTYELCNVGITLVENLSLQRKPFPDMEAVYLVQITSLEDVMKDFEPLPSKDKQNSIVNSSSSSSQNPVSVANQPEEFMYKAAHVFVTSGLSQSHIDQARRNRNFASHCLTLADINLDFVVEEAFVAHFGNNSYIPDLLNGKVRETALLQKYRSQLTSFLVSMNFNPVIRYQEGFNTTYKFASQLKLDIENAQTALQWNNGNPATLLILDRLSDMATPLLFDFSYEGRVIDVFQRGSAKRIEELAARDHVITEAEKDRLIVVDRYNLPDSGPSFSSSSSDNLINMILSDEDPFWVKYRHTFFGIPLEQHGKELARWMEQGDFSEIMQLEKKGSNSSASAPTINKMALHNMSEYTYGKERFSNHELLLKQLDKYGRAHSSNDAATLQNDMLMSAITQKKIERKELLSRLVPLLQDPNIRSTDKLRLLLVFLMTAEKPDDSQKNTLIETAALTPSEQSTIDSLERLGCITTQSLSRSDKEKRFREVMNDILNAEDLPYDVDQYRPLLYDIALDYDRGQLSEAPYPSIEGTGSKQSFNSRRTRNWASGGSDRNNTQGGPLIVFILGGITSAEARIYTELKEMNSGTPNIYLLGTEFLTPYTFLERLEH